MDYCEECEVRNEINVRVRKKSFQGWFALKWLTWWFSVSLIVKVVAKTRNLNRIYISALRQKMQTPLLREPYFITPLEALFWHRKIQIQSEGLFLVDHKRNENWNGNCNWFSVFSCFTMYLDKNTQGHGKRWIMLMVANLLKAGNALRKQHLMRFLPDSWWFALKEFI